MYRTATDEERAAGRSVLTVQLADPFCPAGHVHQRAVEPRRTASHEDPV
jgi:hypothetical protein